MTWILREKEVMKVGDFAQGAYTSSGSRTLAGAEQASRKSPKENQSIGQMASNGIRKNEHALPEELQWLNPSYRQIAQRRLQAAQDRSLPYIIARQAIGRDLIFHDGSIAYEQILLQPSNTKMFGSEGLAWDSSVDKTTFFCIFPGQQNLISMGTINEMFGQKLSHGDIGTLLDVNGYLDDKIDDEDDDDKDPALEAEWEAVSRASFYLLSASGRILPKDQSAATSIFQPLSDEAKGFAMANVMAMSAGLRDLTFLKLAVNLGFDPNQRSRLVEATPLEHAENKKNEVGRQFLVALRPPK